MKIQKLLKIKSASVRGYISFVSFSFSFSFVSFRVFIILRICFWRKKKHRSNKKKIERKFCNPRGMLLERVSLVYKRLLLLLSLKQKNKHTHKMFSNCCFFPLYVCTVHTYQPFIMCVSLCILFSPLLRFYVSLLPIFFFFFLKSSLISLAFLSTCLLMPRKATKTRWKRKKFLSVYFFKHFHHFFFVLFDSKSVIKTFVIRNILDVTKVAGQIKLKCLLWIN